MFVLCSFSPPTFTNQATNFIMQHDNLRSSRKAIISMQNIFSHIASIYYGFCRIFCFDLTVLIQHRPGSVFMVQCLMCYCFVKVLLDCWFSSLYYKSLSNGVNLQLTAQYFANDSSSMKKKALLPSNIRPSCHRDGTTIFSLS